MSVPSKCYAIQLVKFQPEERLATIPELNLAPGRLTYHREVRGMGWLEGNASEGINLQNNNHVGG